MRSRYSSTHFSSVFALFSTTSPSSLSEQADPTDSLNKPKNLEIPAIPATHRVGRRRKSTMANPNNFRRPPHSSCFFSSPASSSGVIRCNIATRHRGLASHLFSSVHLLIAGYVFYSVLFFVYAKKTNNKRTQLPASSTTKQFQPYLYILKHIEGNDSDFLIFQ